jgi:hypothetical protein
MSDGRSIADQVSDNAKRLEEMRRRTKTFGDTQQPGTGAWSVGDYGQALPPKSGF